MTVAEIGAIRGNRQLRSHQVDVMVMTQHRQSEQERIRDKSEIQAIQ